MKFKGPENVTSISVGGECFNVGDDGLIETPDNGNYASLLAPHGFEQAAAERAIEAKTVSDETSGEGEKVANTETAKPAAKKVAAKPVSDETKAPE